MAVKRMFTTQICDSDDFLEMPLSSQCLYFHLNLKADDDGFVNGPKRIARNIGASEDDLKILIMKHFILVFESGVIVIKHFKIHNWIRSDRHKDTVYQDEMSLISLKKNGSYTLNKSDEIELCQPVVSQLSDTCPHSIDQYSLDKYSLEDIVGKNDETDSKKELYKSVIAYLNEKTGRKFTTSKPNCSHINARAEEGHTLDDFKTVIDNMCAKWLNDSKMSEFIRPNTLFGTKFEGYLNLSVKKSNTVFDSWNGRFVEPIPDYTQEKSEPVDIEALKERLRMK